MFECQSAETESGARLFLDDERTKLSRMTIRIEDLSARATARRGDDCFDRAKATIEFLQRRIERLQIISRRSL
ncbi:MAG: hypothetical protein LBI57_05760 [Helicobacteraceae bacterium]|jgi:hypothetical protein|nr:hypothetical protein [Helicobacteraceae bacterium]